MWEGYKMPTRRSPLEDFERRNFMQDARSLLLKRAGRMPPSKHGMMAMQGGAYQPFTMSSRPASAEERNAFNVERERQAKYGQYNQGGLAREKLSQDFMARRMEQQAETERETMRQGGLNRRFDKEQQRLGRQDEWRFAPRTPFRDFQGADREKTAAFRERTRMFAPYYQNRHRPQVFQEEYFGDTGQAQKRYFTPYTDPETGMMRMRPVPIPGRDQGNKKKKQTWYDYDY